MGYDQLQTTQGRPERVPLSRDPAAPAGGVDAFLGDLLGSSELGNAENRDRIARTRTPSANAPNPPPSSAPPGPGSFAPLAGPDLTRRRDHGMSTDAGPMLREIEDLLFPSPGGPGAPCVAEPPTLRDDLGAALGAALVADVPNLAPSTAPDPMGLSNDAATAGMPLITSHYAPYAPAVAPAAFMAGVSVKPTNFGDPLRRNVPDLAEFLEWYASEESATRRLIQGVCGLDGLWWETYTTWLLGTAHERTNHIRERSALFDTFNTTVAGSGTVELGRAFEPTEIPGTIIHEAMHHFEHTDLQDQVGRLEQIRMTTDVFTEGMAEYLARPVIDLTVDAMVAAGTLDPGLAGQAKTHTAYQSYVDQVVQIRDVLYAHGQDGEDAVQRAFFLGEGWRFGLLEGPDRGSPVESDRPVPPPVDVHFDRRGAAATDLGTLSAIVEYLKGRNAATVTIVGRTDPVGPAADNLTLGDSRANSVKAYLTGQGIDAGRITTSSRGEQDQIGGGDAANRRATVTVSDGRNGFATRL